MLSAQCFLIKGIYMELKRILSVLFLSTLLFACGSDDGKYDENGNYIGDTTDSGDSSDTSESDDSTDDDTTLDTGDDDDSGTPDVEAPAEGNSFTFTGASESWIAIKGTGGNETASITFQLLDIYGQAVVDEGVSFVMSGPEGATLLFETGSTDDDGNVSTYVKSGNAAGPITVKVISDSDSSIYSTSNAVYVSTGFPDQESFSIAVDKTAVPGLYHIDATIAVTVSFADAEGNAPIPDGTTVSFRAEAGRIESASDGQVGSCTTVNSACSMTWTSVGEMPDDGHITLLAYATGVESFDDVNPSNGMYDDGESFTDNGEAYLDANFNGSYDIGDEWYLDAEDASGVKDQAYTAGDGKYTGMQCESDVDYCDQGFVYIFKQIEVTATSDELYCAFYDVTGNPISTIALDSDLPSTIMVEVYDENGNTPSVGTTISASTANGAINGDSAWTVPNNDGGPYEFDVELVGDDTTSMGTFTIKANTPAPGTLDSTCTMLVTD